MLAEVGIGGIGHQPVSIDARGVEAAADWGSLRSPENYAGYKRTENFRKLLASYVIGSLKSIVVCERECVVPGPVVPVGRCRHHPDSPQGIPCGVASRKDLRGYVIRFLYESNLLDNTTPIVTFEAGSLRCGLLSNANLRGAWLGLETFPSTDLSCADLKGAFLIGSKYK